MSRLADGSIAPSHVSLASYQARSSSTVALQQNNGALRVGYVVAVHYPLDPGYESSTVILYDIAAPVTTPSGGWSWQIYSNARLGMCTGGSTKDFSRVSIRAPRGWKNGEPLTEEIVNESTMVLFECYNGRSQYPYIIGFAEHDSLFPNSKELGHYYRWDFNGVSTTINKDGEYEVQFTGGILDAGSNAYVTPDPELTGTYIRLDKTGSILLDDVKGESIKLDKASKAITVVARNASTSVTEGDWALSTAGKTNVQASGNAVFNSGAKIYVGTEGSSNPLVLGHELVDALGDLIEKLTGVPLIGQAGPFPCIMHPVLRQQLSVWKARYAQRRSPFLSRKGFVE